MAANPPSSEVYSSVFKGRVFHYPGAPCRNLEIVFHPYREAAAHMAEHERIRTLEGWKEDKAASQVTGMGLWGEAAYSVFSGLPVESSRHYVDPGWDFVHNDEKVEVKTAKHGMNLRALIDKAKGAQFDLIVLIERYGPITTTNRNAFSITGFAERATWELHAREVRNERERPDKWYRQLDRQYLTPASELLVR